MAHSLAAGPGTGYGLRDGLPSNRVEQLRHCGRGRRHPQRVLGTAVHPGGMFPGDGAPFTPGRTSVRDRDSNRGQRSRFPAGRWSHRASHHGREGWPGHVAVRVRDRLPRVSDRSGPRRRRQDARREKGAAGLATARTNGGMRRTRDRVARHAQVEHTLTSPRRRRTLFAPMGKCPQQRSNASGCDDGGSTRPCAISVES